MITFSMRAIEQWAKQRPAGYAEDVFASGEVTRDATGIPQSVSLTQESYDHLCLKYRDNKASGRPPAAPAPDLTRNDAPSFLTKVKNFAVASARHVAAGMPMASDEEIIRRHDLCMACEFMKDGACTKCGCPIVRAKQYVSKLSWADSECPVGKWGKEVPAQS